MSNTVEQSIHDLFKTMSLSAGIESDKLALVNILFVLCIDIVRDKFSYWQIPFIIQNIRKCVNVPNIHS